VRKDILSCGSSPARAGLLFFVRQMPHAYSWILPPAIIGGAVQPMAAASQLHPKEQTFGDDGEGSCWCRFCCKSR
jgi:hypothetical protein